MSLKITKKKWSSARKDLMTAGAVLLVFVVLCTAFDVYEQITEFTRVYEKYQVGELLIAVVGLALAAVWYSFRRIKEVSEVIVELKRSENNRKNLEERYGGIFDHTKNGIAVFRAIGDGQDFIIVDFNRSAEEIEKIAKENVIGKPVTEIFPGIKQLGLLDVFRRVWTTGQPAYHSDAYYKDERIEGWRANFVYKLQSGELVAVYSDETARRRSEDALRNSEEKYRLFVANTKEAIVVAQAGQVKFYSPKVIELLGYTADDFPSDEIAKKHYMDFVHPKDREPVLEHYSMRMGEETVPESFEFRIIDRNGHIKWVAINSVLIDWENKPATLNFLSDITYRKKIEEERIHLETAIEQAAECVIITDIYGSIQYVNPAFENITGYARQEVIGQNPRILKSGKQDRAFYETLWNTLSSGSVWSGHFINMKKDGSLYEVDATFSPVKDSAGEITRYVAVMRDVTEELEKEKQLRQSQKMEAIGTLAGGIAHDFNNILSAVIGYSEILLDKIKKEDSLSEDLQEILTAGVRAKDLVKQILTFSRQAEHELQPVQVSLIVKEALKLLRASMPSTIEIRRNIQSDDTVMADPTQIHQILMNLCTNAEHAMRGRRGVLEVKLNSVDLDEKFLIGQTDAVPGRFLRLTVKDSGHGMTSEVMEKIFDPFFTTKEREEGTGMGLAVVHGIVKNHGGIIMVSSESEKGTTFSVYLPATEMDMKPDSKIRQPLPTGTEHILFVDDEKTLVDLGKATLNRHGYEVTTRTSSIEALELMKSRPHDFDLVVTDLTMPNMTGKELAEEIIRVRTEIPIILCSGFSTKLTEEKAKVIGIRAFIKKPVIQADLLTTVRRVLDA